MARIYTSRQLLDPRMIQMANQATENRIAQEANRRQNVLRAWQDVANTAGGTYDQYRARANREEKLREGIEALRPKPEFRLKYADSPMYQMVMENNPRHMGKNAYFTNQREIDEFDKQINDPAFIAAADEFIRTGTSSPLGNLVLQRQAAEARREAAEQAKIDKDTSDKMHKAVRLANAREEYARNREAYNKAETNADKLAFRLANEALEAEFGADAFGQTMADYVAAREKDEVEARQLAYELEQDKKEQKAIEDKSYDVKNWIRENIIPLGAIKRKEDQIEIADFIRDSKGLTDADRKELLDEVLKNKTQDEAVRTAQQGAAATHAGKKTTEKLEEADNRNKANRYVGKKINGLEWKKIPEDVRQYLKRDGNGNVTER